MPSRNCLSHNCNHSLSHNALQSQLQKHNPSQSQNPSESPNSTSFFFILIIAIIGVLPTCLLVCFHIYASQEVHTHIYFNINNPQDSGFIYDYDDLIYPVGLYLPRMLPNKKMEVILPCKCLSHSGLFIDFYTQMEKDFKIYEYQDEDRNIYYKSPRKFSNEGYFFKNLKESFSPRTNPDEAHLFFIPISSHQMKGNV
ncbi:hypothetical protein CFP56_037013 [Quercus suber]|uniref:Uncharacterized protein n=1 Tax=Quercus suber TaxID=58331 RepID=A0AAW0J776_QUESU